MPLSQEISDSAPVGLFDSGLGGLSVLKEISSLLPNEDIVYLADEAYCPYGGKSAVEVIERSMHCAARLSGLGCKMIVIACNTASAVARWEIRKRFPVPVVALEPAVKPAVLGTKTGKILVLATGITLKGDLFLKTSERLSGKAEFILKEPAGFVEAVEKGIDPFSPEAADIVRRELEPLLPEGFDSVVLGCTHYPFLAPAIKSVLGEGIKLYDPSHGVALQVRRLLESKGILARDGSGTIRFESTKGDAAKLRDAALRLLGRK